MTLRKRETVNRTRYRTKLARNLHIREDILDRKNIYRRITCVSIAGSKCYVSTSDGTAMCLDVNALVKTRKRPAGAYGPLTRMGGL